MPEPAGLPSREQDHLVMPPAAGERRWQRVFPGHERELSRLRRWLSSLLPECPERDEVLSVATELGSNALMHTASGSPDGSFSVQVTWHQSLIFVAVADGGSPGEPRVIENLGGERGRGLLLVQGLSARTGWTGDERGRMVWAQIAWPDDTEGLPETSPDPCTTIAPMTHPGGSCASCPGQPATVGQTDARRLFETLDPEEMLQQR
jgi:anti-sigma regulatory factor (Ser/Thr protein kinase)